jgi:hypothetical protein
MVQTHGPHIWIDVVSFRFVFLDGPPRIGADTRYNHRYTLIVVAQRGCLDEL